MQLLTGSRSFVNMFTWFCLVLLENMANFAGFDQAVNVSLERNFLPKIEKSQTVENENR